MQLYMVQTLYFLLLFDLLLRRQIHESLNLRIRYPIVFQSQSTIIFGRNLNRIQTAKVAWGNQNISKDRPPGKVQYMVSLIAVFCTRKIYPNFYMCNPSPGPLDPRMWGSVWRRWMRSARCRWPRSTCRNTVNSSPRWKRWGQLPPGPLRCPLG